MKSLEATLEVKNKLGVHLRAAALLAGVVRNFESTITITFENREANARSVLQLVMLRATHGTRLNIKIDGPDASAALAAVTSVFAQRFGENQG